MLNAGEVTVWRANLDALDPASLPPLLPLETGRAGHFHSEEVRQRYIRSHGVLRAILAQLGLPAVYTRDSRGKPYLAGTPDIHFSLARSHGMALYAAARGFEVGVDIERYRPLPEHMAIAGRFMPPSLYSELLDAAPECREREFLSIWTRVEAALKALGTGLYGAGEELAGDWTIQVLDAGDGFAAAVAARATGVRVTVRDFAL